MGRKKPKRSFEEALVRIIQDGFINLSFCHRYVTFRGKTKKVTYRLEKWRPYHPWGFSDDRKLDFRIYYQAMSGAHKIVFEGTFNDPGLFDKVEEALQRHSWVRIYGTN